MKLTGLILISAFMLFLTEKGRADTCTSIFKSHHSYNEKQVANFETLMFNKTKVNNSQQTFKQNKVEDENKKKIFVKTPETFIVFMPFLDSFIN